MKTTHISLRTQLVFTFGVLVLGLSSFVSLALGSMLYQQLEREQGDVLTTVSKNAANVLADDLRKNARSASILAASSALWIEGLDSTNVVGALARVKAINPDITWIGVADQAGVVRAATDGLLVGENVKSRPWFEPALRGIHVGDVHEAKLLAGRLPPTANGEPRRFVDFAAPIRLGGHLIGALAIHGGWEWADEVVQKLAPENSQGLGIETFIFDRSGVAIYAHGDELRALRTAKQDPPLWDKEPAAKARWKDGRDYLTAAARLPTVLPGIDLGWTVITRQPEKTAFSAARRAQWAALAIGTVSAMLSVVLAWFLANRMARPLVLIAQAAGQVSGRSAVVIPVQGGSREVVALSESLTHMTQRLFAANEELEARVAQRTRELADANAELSRLASFDPLTGLMNRRGFEERAAWVISAARRTGAPIGVVIVDADHFKRVNDGLGHAAGDTALRFLANAMVRALRESDVVGRFGGEEFAAILPDCDSAGALLAAEKICQSMRALVIPEVGTLTVSCGASELIMPQANLAAALIRADEALYCAKRGGRDQARIYEPCAGFPPVFAPSLRRPLETAECRIHPLNADSPN